MLMENYNQLSTYLEFLNISGSEKQKAEATQMSNNIVTQMHNFTGKISTFEHENRTALLFAVPNRGTTSSDSSTSNSRNVSQEKQPKRDKVRYDDSLDIIVKFQETFAIWNKEATRITEEDRSFTWSSVIVDGLARPRVCNQIEGGS